MKIYIDVRSHRARIMRFWRTKHGDFVREMARNWRELEYDASRAVVMQGGTLDIPGEWAVPDALLAQVEWRKMQVEWITIAEAVYDLEALSIWITHSQVGNWIDRGELDVLILGEAPQGYGRRKVRPGQVRQLGRRLQRRVEQQNAPSGRGWGHLVLVS